MNPLVAVALFVFVIGRALFASWISFKPLADRHERGLRLLKEWTDKWEGDHK